MDSITFSLLTSSVNPLHFDKFLTTTSSTAATTTTTTTGIINGTGSAAELTKTLIPEKYQVILLSFAYGIISLLAVVGNACIIYIVLRNRRMHSVTNYFICNLALSDCLVACFAVPFQVCHLFSVIKQIYMQIFLPLVSSGSSSKMGFTSFSLQISTICSNTFC
jgi:hypothetical protein